MPDSRPKETQRNKENRHHAMKTLKEMHMPQFNTVKPRPHERFFVRAGDAIFSNFVASPA